MKKSTRYKAFAILSLFCQAFGLWCCLVWKRFDFCAVMFSMAALYAVERESEK